MKIGKCYAEQKFRYSLSRHETLKALLKYKNHPSKIIKSFSRHFSSVYFSQVDKKIAFLKTSKFYKVVHQTNPHARILKENADYFAEYTGLQINVAITVRSVQIRTFSARNFPVVELNKGKTDE